MENLNEGKKKKASAYMAELAEIDKQSAIVAMEAKINKLAEMVETKNARLSMVSEDENLSELIDKKQVKMMEREIKEIEKAKLKLEKLYEKMSGSKKKEVVKEEDPVDEGHGMDSMYDEDDSVSEGGYDSNYEEDEDGVKEETNEEVNRWQKLAGISLQENKEEISKVLNENESPQLTDQEKKDLRGGIENFLRDTVFNTDILANDSEEFNPTKEERVIQYIIDDLTERISYY